MRARKIFKKLVIGGKKIYSKELDLSKLLLEGGDSLRKIYSGTEETKPIGYPIIIKQEIIREKPTEKTPEIKKEEKKEEEKEEKKDRIEVKVEGIKIPRSLKIVPASLEDEKVERFRLSYPLVPKNPKPGERVFSQVNIYFDETKGKYIYFVIEPKLDDRLKNMKKRIEELLEQRLDVDLSKLNLLRAKEYLKNQLDEIIRYFKFRLTEDEYENLRYYLERDFLGFGKIDPLMQDQNIEDISCDGVGLPIFVFHRDPRLGSIETNIVFESSEELDSFIVRLAQLAGKSVSIAEPLVNGTLPDGTRLQATLATDIARRGSNFTLRKFMKEPLTPVHVMKYGTADERVLAYLWMAVDFGRSILVSGGTASGKTTILNVLSLFIRPEKKIVSIEDTAEIILPHTHWVPMVARVPISTGKVGEVDLFHLLIESLRQRPDYIIVGEVRGQEAYVLFQQMATGHPSFATIHAENIDKLIDRLTTPPISLPEGLIGSLDIVVFMQRMRYKEKFVRRITEIVEIVGFPKGYDKPVYNKVFTWNAYKDVFEIGEMSVVLKKISQLTGISEKEIMDEFQRRVAILKWMKDHDIVNFKDVYTIINAYYTMPNRVLAMISE
ncbi:MAG: type II/IV secretion system ATPase subunit [Candidatus Aenigmarchaeota archaeon]|nr:type II/IV secretion system ATPase subunit [Candidatus Aenigmarchaeota archaeon]MDW8159865.1 type II/IV secretion system ATPase subunit [Candidatus Aenigmarchaeota archaeon]